MASAISENVGPSSTEIIVVFASAQQFTQDDVSLHMPRDPGALQQCADALRFTSDGMKNNEVGIQAAVMQNGRALRYASINSKKMSMWHWQPCSRTEMLCPLPAKTWPSAYGNVHKLKVWGLAEYAKAVLNALIVQVISSLPSP